MTETEEKDWLAEDDDDDVAWERIVGQMNPYYKLLTEEASKEYDARSIDPDKICVRLNEDLFIQADVFDRILGDQRIHYIAWSNLEKDQVVEYWDDEETLDELSDDATSWQTHDDKFWNDAMDVVDYGDSLGCRLDDIVMADYAARDDGQTNESIRLTGWLVSHGVSQALYLHPNVTVDKFDDGAVVRSTANPNREVRLSFADDTWTARTYQNGVEQGEPKVFKSRYYANDRVFGKAVAEYAITYVDPLKPEAKYE